MRNLLKVVTELYEKNNDFQRKLGSYDRAMKTEDWKFMHDAILIIKGQMAVDMFSRSHTQLDATEKDVIQRTYHYMNDILTFLSEPEKWVRKKSIFNLANLNPNKRKAS